MLKPKGALMPIILAAFAAAGVMSADPQPSPAAQTLLPAGQAGNAQPTTVSASDTRDSARFTLTAEDTQRSLDAYNARVEEREASATESAATEAHLAGTITITGDNASEYGAPLGTYQIYGYNPLDPSQVGKGVADGVTASGEQAIPGETCAMSRDVPYGTMVYVEGLGVYRVNDRGVGRGVVDIAAATDAECYAITRKARVWILEATT
jgi:hypothetical protein